MWFFMVSSRLVECSWSWCRFVDLWYGVQLSGVVYWNVHSCSGLVRGCNLEKNIVIIGVWVW